MIGQAVLVENNTGEFLLMSWSVVELPYFRMWINEGHFNDKLMVALELCNDYYDSLVEAHKREKTLTLEPEDTTTWSFDIELGVNYR